MVEGAIDWTEESGGRCDRLISRQRNVIEMLGNEDGGEESEEGEHEGEICKLEGSDGSRINRLQNKGVDWIQNALTHQLIFRKDFVDRKDEFEDDKVQCHDEEGLIIEGQNDLCEGSFRGERR